MRSQEAHQAVSSVIAQVYNTDFQVSIAALGQLDKLMKDNDKVELIGPGLTSCLQYRYVLQTKMKMDLVKRASTAVLHDVVNVILLEPGVADLPKGGRLVRALNLLTIKIMDRSGHNTVSGALVRLLHECIGSSVLGGKYCMLAIKCIWKVNVLFLHHGGTTSTSTSSTYIPFSSSSLR